MALIVGTNTYAAEVELDAYAAAPMGIYAVFPQRRHLPLRVRLFVDQLKAAFENADYWESSSDVS